MWHGSLLPNLPSGPLEEAQKEGIQSPGGYQMINIKHSDTTFNNHQAKTWLSSMKEYEISVTLSVIKDINSIQKIFGHHFIEKIFNFAGIRKDQNGYTSLDVYQITCR